MIEKRLLVVSGKGGVGKSTVTAALALAAASAGRRTLVAEVSGRSDVARLLGAEPGAPLVEIELAPKLHHVTIDRRATLKDYLDHEVPGPVRVGALTRSRAFTAFVEATPGMGELLSIGKVSELARPRRGRRGPRPYDLVVLDGPASGQLLALLDAPKTFGAIARVGPVARQTADIDRLLRDHRRTGVIAVTTPEQMAVSEALALHTAVEARGLSVDAVVVNKAVPSPFSSAEERRLREAPDDPAIASARWLSIRARAQRQHIDRLRRALPDIRRTRLPFLFTGVDRGALDGLAAQLGRGVA